MSSTDDRSAPPKVLVADDDPVVCRTLRRYLTPHYQVTTVEDGRAAVDAYLADPPDLVIVDLQMPALTGVEVAAEIRRRHGDRPGPPVLLMSGLTDPDQVSRSLAAGVSDFIAKPFVREELLAKVGELLEAHQRRREAERQRAELDAWNARRDLEEAAARAVLERMLGRGALDPDETRRFVAPASTFAGDVLFGATTPRGTYRWMVGDVTSHTLSSALVTIPISMIFHATTQQTPSLVDTLAIFERELAALLPVNLFCAAALCELDRARGVVQIWNGGLPSLLIRRHASREVVRVESFDPPLGVARRLDWPRALRSIPVAPGDRILAFSDGLVETRGDDGALLGLDAIAEVAGSGDPADLFDRVIARWRDHAGGDHDDDVSVFEVTV